MPTLHRVDSPNDIDSVVSLARDIWNEHFSPMIGQAQVDYMLDAFQSASAISEQMRGEGCEYYLVEEAGHNVGYLALVLDQDSCSMQLSKLYLLKAHRGRGLGRWLVERIEAECAARGMKRLWLTVNRNNTDSILFYQRVGFKIDDTVVTDIGAGFVMDDYCMTKLIEP